MDEMSYEMIKSCAYGAGPKELSDLYEISMDDATEFIDRNSTKIQSRKEKLREEGYIR